MNRILTHTEKQTPTLTQSKRGLMVAHKRPAETFAASLAVLCLPANITTQYSKVLNYYLQYKTCIIGGLHLIDLVVTSDKIAKRFGVSEKDHPALFEVWLNSGFTTDNLIIDKSTFIAYANPACFNWDKLQIVAQSIEMSTKKPSNLREEAAKPKNLTAIRASMMCCEAERVLIECFEAAFTADMRPYLNYGHLMDADETARHCKELGIPLDA